MDIKRKKELLAAYNNRRPEMGVISFKCSAAVMDGSGGRYVKDERRTPHPSGV